MPLSVEEVRALYALDPATGQPLAGTSGIVREGMAYTEALNTLAQFQAGQLTPDDPNVFYGEGGGPIQIDYPPEAYGSTSEQQLAASPVGSILTSTGEIIPPSGAPAYAGGSPVVGSPSSAGVAGGVGGGRWLRCWSGARRSGQAYR